MRVLWNKKLPVPTNRYPTKLTRKMASCPFFLQFWIPLNAKYINSRFVNVLTTSATYGVR